MFEYKKNKVVIIFKILGAFWTGVLVFIASYLEPRDLWTTPLIAVIVSIASIYLFTLLVSKLTNDKWQIAKKTRDYTNNFGWKGSMLWSFLWGLIGGIAYILGSSV